MAASTNSESSEPTRMSEETRLLFDQLDKYLTERLLRAKKTDPLLKSYHPIPSLKVDVRKLQKRLDCEQPVNGWSHDEDVPKLSNGGPIRRKQTVHKMKTDFETEEDAEVAKYLDTALNVQPGLNWRLLALRRQASMRNGPTSYANCSASPKTGLPRYQQPGSATLGTKQSDLDSQYVRKRLEREQQQQRRPAEKLALNEHPVMTNGNSGNHGNTSIQDLRTPRRSYSFRETDQRRSSSAVPSDQASMLSGEKAALQSRRINSPPLKSDAANSTLQRRLAYDPLASKLTSRPARQSTDKSAPSVSGPEAKQKQASTGTVQLRRSATSTNGQVTSHKEPRQRISSPPLSRLNMLSPPPTPLRGLQNGVRSPLSPVPKRQTRMPASAPSEAEGGRGQINGQADPLRQSRKVKTDKTPAQKSLQRVDSKTPNSKERQPPERAINVNSHYPDMGVESINVKLERLTTHVLELRRRVERDYAESGSCSPGDDIYGDEEVGAISSGKPTGMHPVVASSLKNIRVLEANIQEVFDLLYPNEVEIWSPQQTRRKYAL
ncbi:hypothetical protein AAHC03_09170 [Spirometra sp. Aus1]